MRLNCIRSFPHRLKSDAMIVFTPKPPPRCSPVRTRITSATGDTANIGKKKICKNRNFLSRCFDIRVAGTIVLFRPHKVHPFIHVGMCIQVWSQPCSLATECDPMCDLQLGLSLWIDENGEDTNRCCIRRQIPWWLEASQKASQDVCTIIAKLEWHKNEIKNEIKWDENGMSTTECSVCHFWN